MGGWRYLTDPNNTDPFMTLKLFGGGYVTSIISIAVYTRRRLDQGHWFGRLGKALAGSAIVSYGLKMALTS